jgi:hypothetical protein
LATSEDGALQILQRVLSLSKLRVDYRYAHPFDIPLATYLWVLSRTSPDLAQAGAEVAVDLPRMWWSEQVCRYILGGWTQKPTTVGVRRMSADSANADTSNVAAGSTSLFFSDSQHGFPPAKESIKVNVNADQTSAAQKTVNEGKNGGPPSYTTSGEHR